jgi:hypothetical protein
VRPRFRIFRIDWKKSTSNERLIFLFLKCTGKDYSCSLAGLAQDDRILEAKVVLFSTIPVLVVKIAQTPCRHDVKMMFSTDVQYITEINEPSGNLFYS